jgi:ankyrin repeat protein
MIEIIRPVGIPVACALMVLSLQGYSNFASAQGRYQPSALCQAIVAGDLTRATQLVENGADVNASYGCALVAASSRGQLKLTELLLDRGANPNRVVSGDLTVVMGGSTPLVSAVQSRDVRMVQLLLDKGANPKTDFEAFNFVLTLGHVEMAELLLRHGANACMIPPPEQDVYAFPDGRMVKVAKRDLEPDRIDDTAKRMQCRITLQGTPLLHMAVAGGFGPSGQDGRMRIARMLIYQGADLNSRSINGSTPLMEAASQHDHAAMKMLMDAGADVMATDRCGRTAEDYPVSRPKHQRAHLAPQTKALLQERQRK